MTNEEMKHTSTLCGNGYPILDLTCLFVQKQGCVNQKKKNPNHVLPTYMLKIAYYEKKSNRILWSQLNLVSIFALAVSQHYLDLYDLNFILATVKKCKKSKIPS